MNSILSDRVLNMEESATLAMAKKSPGAEISRY